MRKLRRFYDADRLKEVYASPYDHTRWEEHRIRVAHTSEVAQRLIDTHGLNSAADLSTGDCAIPRALRRLDSLETADGNIEDELKRLTSVGLFLCTETIEHLEAPWTVLEAIAAKTKWILLSTPLDEQNDENWEHYWSFDLRDVDDMLRQSGFHNRQHECLTRPGWNYTYQIWTAQT